MNHRVVVTGIGALSALGSEWSVARQSLEAGRSAVRVLEELGEFEGMDTRLGAPLQDFETPAHYPRKRTRSMGRVSLLAARATELALEDATLTDHPVLSSGQTGISYGSTSGSPPAMGSFASRLHDSRTLKGICSTDYLQFMSHTVPANLSQFFGIRGRMIPTTSACTAGSQGIGYGYEAIATGKQQVMIAGGAEEFHPSDVCVFDVMYATSTRNSAPETTPRPFDVDRDGLVIGEGAGTLILEELTHAQERGAKIYAEVLGFATNCDGKHITSPDAEGMARVLLEALSDAELQPEEIDYVNAHGTATLAGDIAESLATETVLGGRTPISSLKSFLGHTLGACGALEAWLSIEMLRQHWFAPTLNLDHVDPRCADLDYIQQEGRVIDARFVMSNNFAFGGVNTSLIFGHAPS